MFEKGKYRPITKKDVEGHVILSWIITSVIFLPFILIYWFIKTYKKEIKK